MSFEGPFYPKLFYDSINLNVTPSNCQLHPPQSTTAGRCMSTSLFQRTAASPGKATSVELGINPYSMPEGETFKHLLTVTVY